MFPAKLRFALILVAAAVPSGGAVIVALAPTQRYKPLVAAAPEKSQGWDEKPAPSLRTRRYLSWAIYVFVILAGLVLCQWRAWLSFRANLVLFDLSHIPGQLLIMIPLVPVGLAYVITRAIFAPIIWYTRDRHLFGSSEFVITVLILSAPAFYVFVMLFRRIREAITMRPFLYSMILLFVLTAVSMAGCVDIISRPIGMQ